MYTHACAHPNGHLYIPDLHTHQEALFIQEKNVTINVMVI